MTNEQLLIKALHQITQCASAHDARDIAHEALVKLKGQSAIGWPDESRINAIGQNGATGEHYYVTDTKKKASPETPNKYRREIKNGVFVDVYDVLSAWRVSNPALQHLIKKALQPGLRGHKTLNQDMQDIIDSAIRAQQIEKELRE